MRLSVGQSNRQQISQNSQWQCNNELLFIDNYVETIRYIILIHIDRVYVLAKIFQKVRFFQDISFLVNWAYTWR